MRRMKLEQRNPGIAGLSGPTMTAFFTAVGLVVFGDFITPALPITAGCEWRVLLIALGGAGVGGNEEAGNLISSNASEP